MAVVLSFHAVSTGLNYHHKLETCCLPETGYTSRKLRLRCGCQFPWCAFALVVLNC
jgi:hypothetical protein